MGKGRRPRCCLCKPEGAVVKGIFDGVYLAVDSSVLFMFSYCHHLIIVMHWLNSGPNQKIWVTTVSACRRSTIMH